MNVNPYLISRRPLSLLPSLEQAASAKAAMDTLASPVDIPGIPCTSFILSLRGGAASVLPSIKELILKCKEIVEEEGEKIDDEDYMNDADPSILRFLLASREEV